MKNATIVGILGTVLLLVVAVDIGIAWYNYAIIGGGMYNSGSTTNFLMTIALPPICLIALLVVLVKFWRGK